MSTVVTGSCIFDNMSRSSHPHDALDTLMQRLERLGTDNGSTDEDYSFAGQPPALVSTSNMMGGYHGFGSGAGAASVGSGTGEYMLLQSTPLRSGAVGLVNRRSGSGTRASPLGFGSALSTHSGGSWISTRRSNSPSIPLRGSKLFRVTILDNPDTICYLLRPHWHRKHWESFLHGCAVVPSFSLRFQDPWYTQVYRSCSGHVLLSYGSSSR